MHWKNPRPDISTHDNQLRVLLAEDSADDAEFLNRELTAAGYQVAIVRVESAEGMQNALRSADFDIVLSDYAVPGFGALQALQLLRESGRDIPFIIVSGAITDETAVAGMRAGAHDYVLKDNLARLAPAVKRELEEARQRASKRQTEAALEERDRQLRTVLDALPVGVFICDAAGRMMLANPAANAIWGADVPMVGLDEYGRYQGRRPGSIEPMKATDWPLSRAVRTGESTVNEEVEILAFDGTRKTILNNALAIRNEAGEIVGAVAVDLDITERKKVEQAVKESEEHARRIIDNMLAFVGEMTVDGTLLDVNAAALEIAGLTRDDVIGKKLWDCYWWNYDEEVSARLRDTVAAAARGEVVRHDAVILVAGHSRMIVDFMLAPVRTEAGEISHIIPSAVDITERKAAEAEARHGAELLDLGDAFFELDRKWRIVRVNANQEKLSRTPRSQTLGRVFWDVWPQIGPGSTYWLQYHRCMEERVPVEFEDYFAPLNLWTGVTAYPTSTGMAVFFRDVSDRKSAEQALRESQESFKAVAENIPQMIWVADKNSKYEYLSPKWLSYTGTTAEENANGGWVRSLHPEDAPHAAQRWEEAVRTKGKYETEYRLRRYDGEYRWHFARAVPIKDEGAKTLWFGTITDIEDQKRTNLSLIRSEKLAAAGRLASTMAHEVNNPLAAALNSLYLALLDNSLGESTRNHISLAERELKRVAHITRQTLGFHKGTGKATKVSLRNIAEKVVELYSSQLGNKDIRLECEYRADAPVLAVEGEVLQIFANLLSNSIDAVDNHGCIRLRVAGPVTFDGNRPAIRITVSDNGSGIDPKHLPRIFEPFFSTKEAYGTGLGLWVTQQLVKKHNGKIRARSNRRTTVFEVFLPLERRKPERLENEIEAIA